MKDLNGRTAVVTGASGGLGVYITHALAEAGCNLVLNAFPGVELEPLQQAVAKNGRKAIALALDLREPAQRVQLLERARQEFGAIDILVNNAGVELSSQYHELPEQWLNDILAVNLEAPMRLSWLVLPEMLKRGSGHIVNVSSLAGKAGPGYQEPYAATKAGLIAFTQSLRATYHGTGVSASVICPGFIEAGIYARLKQETGCSAPWTLGTSVPEPVARAVVRAIRKDLPEVIINALPVRPLFAFIALFPRGGEWLVRQLGVHKFFKRSVEAQKQKQKEKDKPKESQAAA